MKTLLTCLLVLAAATAQAQTGIYFSEYLEGSSNNKAVEIYNGTINPLDMSRITVERYNNGSLTISGGPYTYTATLAPGDVYVIANPSAAAGILAVADETSDLTFYNGDDVLLLLLDGVLIDSIGQLGFDPGTNWSAGGCATSEMTLVRKGSSCFGDTDSGDVYDPSVDWDCFAQDDFSNLGFHNTGCVVPSDDAAWGAVKNLYR